MRYLYVSIVLLLAMASEFGLSAPTPEEAQPLVRPLNGFATSSKTIRCAAFSPDGRRLAVGGWDQAEPPTTDSSTVSPELSLWDVQGRRKVATLEGHKGAVRAVAFSPDGRTLASSAEDRSVRFWDGVSGQLKQTFPNLPGHIVSLAFSPEGKTLAGAVGTNGDVWDESHPGTVMLWDVATATVRAKLEGHGSSYSMCLTYSPDGSILAVASGRWSADKQWWVSGEVKLWDAVTMKLRATLIGHRRDIKALTFSPDGKTLATGNDFEPDSLDPNTGEIKVWDIKTQKNRATIQVHLAWVNRLAYSPDGRFLASGSALGARYEPDLPNMGYTKTEFSEVCILDARSLKTLATLPDHSACIEVLTFQPGSSVLLTAGGDKSLKMWDLSHCR